MATEDSRLAVVDLGSNSFRLVVFEIHAARPGALGGWWKRTDEIHEPVRVGAGVDSTGALGEDGMTRASAAIEVFAHFCEAAGLAGDEVDVVATSAIREATNSEEFLDRARAVERPGDPRPLARGGGPVRPPRRRQLDRPRQTAPSSTSAAARSSSCACTGDWRATWTRGGWARCG